MRRRLAGVVLAALLAAGCRAPGEPPSHPAPEEYQDLMRRELATIETAIGTTRLTLRLAAQGDLTRPYGEVVMRQNASDLDVAATDLREVTPPARFAAQHRALRAVVERVAALAHDLSDRFDDRALRREARRTLGDDSDRVSALDKRITAS